MGGLAETLNQMAADLEDKLATVVRQRNDATPVRAWWKVCWPSTATSAAPHERRRGAASGGRTGPAEGRSLPEIVRSIDLHKLVTTVISTQQPTEGEVVLRDRGEPRYLHVHGTVLRDAPEGRTAPCW